jgi:CheY-like chemotaxis protein
LIETILEGEGYQTDTAANGREALEVVECAMPDLIVLDLAMPEMDGWRFLEELHQRGLRRRTRVIIVSGQVDAETMGRPALPVRHFLSKPFEVDSLVSLVADALAQEPDELYVRRERTGELARLLQRMDEVLS